MLKPGSTLGSVTILEELGRGGMGVVYRGRDPVHGEVAIKVLAPDLAQNVAFAERFAREARLSAKVVHPNVVRLHRAERAQGLTFLVIELVPGGSLADLLKTRGRIPWREAARLGAGIARGLAAVHDAGLVHRDVKPANVLLSGDVPKVADFGLARRTTPRGGSLALTAAGDIVGTPEYSAPENADGSSSVGPAADVYALGATLHELVAGRPPFQGQGFEVLKKHLVEVPPRLDTLVGDVPEALTTLVQRLLAKDPAARGSAATVADELEALTTVAPAKSRRGPRLLLLASALVVLALAGAAAVAWRASPARPPPPAPVDPSWTRGPVADARLGEAIATLETASRESAPPEWVAKRLAELREKEALLVALRAARTPDEREKLLAAFLARAPLHPDAPWARARLDAEKLAVASTGWSHEALPPNVRRGRQPPILVLAQPHTQLELELVYVSPGPFLRGVDRTKATLERGFFLGRTEVTWGAYRVFCQDTHHAEAALPTFAGGLGWIGPRDGIDHPVVNVTWGDAVEFCKWVGGRLPKEIEWERAARGPDGRRYPWGDEWDPRRANTNDESCPADYVYAGGAVGERQDASFNDGFGFTAPVGSFPLGASPEGALDLCGNVWEWCHEVDENGNHAIRGGSWEVNWKNCRVDYGNWWWSSLGEAVGFRVVLDAP